ncbi:AAA family ATPase [Corynebacterium sp. ES2794-CONJ1]|uniref:AAA family ATPase n=1 Tax=unclassified Corynebacterium TaxID=2624378 RepID=UPI002168C65C|nr:MULTISPECIES: AAA family ATPase [unclassified Corynebacterium]MCS4489405.1 AAA family ATPase [Corynebacterium sp. ES2775-CONJ]MCS4491216.1 AAA family ATPase [Corynebacterium sp. ES2715-CONJ3]MCS4530903.1 AAA family ATPase [Corynebacterium sp. ES2730-CONJ]MCU9518268.1 AAA family ATPase [Corynebacterium sp. ES2794-CONJ1]
MPALVVSGLASGVGKTTAAAAIVKVLKDRGEDVIPAKVAALSAWTPDIGTIERLTGIKGKDFSQDPDPIASVRELIDAGKTVVVEGSGGLDVELFGAKTIAHIAADLNAPLIVVSGMDEQAVKIALRAVDFATACGATVGGLLGGKLPLGADLKTRLILMDAVARTGVPFLGSLQDGIGSLGPDAFAEATRTIYLPSDF